MTFQKKYCKDHKYISISDLTIVNRISIIIAIPFFEYFFWNVTFYVDAKKEPFCVKCIKVAKIRKCVKRIQNFVRDYFHPLDPILKKMFWGLLFTSQSVSSLGEICSPNYHRTEWEGWGYVSPPLLHCRSQIAIS